MSKELEALKRIETTFSMNKQDKESVYRGYTNSVYPYYEDFDLVLKALQRLESIDNSNPSEALDIFNKVDNIRLLFTKEEKSIIKQALIQAEQDKKKLNEIEKLTHLRYSERRKIGQEYVKWCKENNAVFNDETNMITWVLAIKLKEVLEE